MIAEGWGVRSGLSRQSQGGQLRVGGSRVNFRVMIRGGWLQGSLAQGGVSRLCQGGELRVGGSRMEDKDHDQGWGAIECY